MKTLVIIPSRLSATRLPGKPLLKINGLSIISHVLKRAEEANIGEVVVAAEDKEIVEDVKKNGGKVKKLINYPIFVNSNSTARIQETHIMLGHIILNNVEKNLLKK